MNTPDLPADAYPRAVYAADRHITPDSVYVESTETTLILWFAGIMAGVSRNSDDSRLQAAHHLAGHLRDVAERYGAMVRAELEQRERIRRAEPIAAAMRAATHARPATPAPAGQPGTPPAPGRYCTGCGARLGAAVEGQADTDTRRDCLNCRVEALADQVRARAEHPPAPPAPSGPVLPTTGMMTAVDDSQPNEGRPR